jgi:hypothetical protein
MKIGGEDTEKNRTPTESSYRFGEIEDLDD